MRTAAGRGHDQAFVSQYLDGPAHGRAGYTTQVHDVFLAGDLASRLELARLDLSSEPCCYLPVRRLGGVVVDLDLHDISVPVADSTYPLSYGADCIAQYRDGALRVDIC